MKIKTIALRNAKEGLSGYITEAQRNFILITKHGRPAAIVLGVEGHDFEDIFYMTNRSFWAAVRRRRLQKSIPWHKAKRIISE